MKKVLVFLPILIIAFSIVYVGNKLNHPKTEIPEEMPAQQISALRLFNEYQLLEITANSKYLNKPLEVNGKVKDIIRGMDGKIFIMLDAGNPVFGIKCMLATKDTTLVNQIQKDQEISVKGTCKGILMDVVLADCHIVKESLFQF